MLNLWNSGTSLEPFCPKQKSMSIEPGSPEQRSYYHKHAERIETCFEDALNAAFDTGASDPVAFVAQHMAAAAAAAAPISAKSAHRREVAGWLDTLSIPELIESALIAESPVHVRALGMPAFLSFLDCKSVVGLVHRAGIAKRVWRGICALRGAPFDEADVALAEGALLSDAAAALATSAPPPAPTAPPPHDRDGLEEVGELRHSQQRADARAVADAEHKRAGVPAVAESVDKLIADAKEHNAKLGRDESPRQPKKIVLTGGPGVGKTTLIEDASARLGCKVVPEAAMRCIDVLNQLVGKDEQRQCDGRTDRGLIGRAAARGSGSSAAVSASRQ